MRWLTNYFIFIFGLLLSFIGNSQEEWNLVKTYPIESAEIWTVDVQSNVLIINQDQIKKYNSSGEEIFRQSIKSLGTIKSICALNAMRFLVFSEEQQSVSFIDNSLTLIENSVDLADYDIDYATLVTPSNQSDKMWVFDQINYRLKLVPFKGSIQAQEISNISNLLEIDTVYQILEKNNKLYLNSKSKGVYVMDGYGTLIQRITGSDFLAMDATDDYLFILSSKELIVTDLRTMRQEKIPLPNKEFKEFKVRGKSIYFRSEQEIEHYEFLFIK